MFGLDPFPLVLVHVLLEELPKSFSGTSTWWIGLVVSGASHGVHQHSWYY